MQRMIESDYYRVQLSRPCDDLIRDTKIWVSEVITFLSWQLAAVCLDKVGDRRSDILKRTPPQKQTIRFLNSDIINVPAIPN
jgi:hypothetical protein